MKIFALRSSILLVALVSLADSQTRAAADNSKAVEDMKKVQVILKDGEIATSSTGFFMKAKINGKEWSAATMMRTEDTGRILGLRGEDSISLPLLKSRMVTGKTMTFGETRAVDMFSADYPGLWGAKVGEMTFTKVDAGSAEGTFFFTATSDSPPNKIEVTGGTFRILLGRK